jgi:NAD(P)-dependent dehydrogenase (short-subunit alcohol dehydrogenase family)
MDLTNHELLKFNFQEKLNSFGKVSGFAHFAGQSYIAPLQSIEKNKLLMVFDINVYAAIEMIQILSRARNRVTEDFSIVLISSIYGHVGSAANTGYAASKGAILSITKSLAIELAKKQIRVNSISPGFIQTELLNDVANIFHMEDISDRKASSPYLSNLEAMHPLGLGSPKDISNVCVFLLSGLSRWITGSNIICDGGFTAQ